MIPPGNRTEQPDLPDDLRVLDRQLRGALHRFDCPTAHALGEYELGLLGPEQRTTAAAHVLECPLCADELRMLRAYMKDAPPPVTGPTVAQRLRGLVATLVPPPTTALGYSGLRGAGGARTYRAAALSITLGPGSARLGRASLTGLVVRDGLDEQSLDGAEVRLLAAGDGPAVSSQYVTEVDTLGNFSFDEVAPGTYRLELRLGELTVAIEELAIGG